MVQPLLGIQMQVSAALQTRAAVVANAPTKSLMSLVSDRDRHLFLMGTQTDLSDPDYTK
jgi:hypothetical protein